MTIPEAIKKYPLNLSPQLIRCWIANKTCPFGYIVREGSRRTYYINEVELKKFVEGQKCYIVSKQ